MNLQSKVLKALVWSATKIWGSYLASFLIFLTLSRLLTPEAFGLVALASIFIALAEIFLNQGFSAAIVQRTDLDRAHLDTAFWTGVLSAILLMVGSLAVSEQIAALFQEPQLAPILRWLSISFILNSLSSVQQAILRRDLKFKSLALRSLIATVTAGLVGITLALWGGGVWSLVAQILVNSLVNAVIMWQVSDWRPGFHFSIQHFKTLFTFGISIIGLIILDLFNRRAADFLIGYFLGPTILGYYTIAYRFLLVMIKLLTSITNAVAFPLFSQLQHDPERMRRAFYKAAQWTSLFAFPAFLGMSLLAPQLVVLLFGEKWTPSIPVMQILAVIGILQSVLYFNTSVINGVGKPAWSLSIMGINALVSLLLFLFAVQWGILAVAIAYVISGYLVAPLSYWAVYRLIQIDMQAYLRCIAAPLASSLIMAGFIWGLKPFFLTLTLSQPVQLAIFILLGGLIYLVAIQFLARTLSEQIIGYIRLALSTLRRSNSSTEVV